LYAFGVFSPRIKCVVVCGKEACWGENFDIWQASDRRVKFFWEIGESHSLTLCSRVLPSFVPLLFSFAPPSANPQIPCCSVQLWEKKALTVAIWNPVMCHYMTVAWRAHTNRVSSADQSCVLYSWCNCFTSAHL
jgi:hypothetical protein